MKATVVIRLKPEIYDAAGKTVTERLVDHGFLEVKDARVGKVVELELEGADRENATERVKQMCERLLANQVIEDFVLVSIQ